MVTLLIVLLLLVVLAGGDRAALLFSLAVMASGGCSRPAPLPPANRALLLVRAVRGDSVGAVRQLLDAGVPPDTMAPDGTRPLTEAARHGRVAAARVLLDAAARLDVADSTGTTAFDYAVDAGHREVAALLVREAARDAGASSLALAWFDSLPVATASAGDWHRILDGELASLGLAGAVLNRRDGIAGSLRHAGGIPNRTGYPALVLAARFGDETAVNDLLAASVNPDAEVAGHWHETPLMEAALDGHVAIGRRLLHAAARVDHVDSRRQTALMWAVREGETEYARMLLEAGANPMLRDSDGETALDLAHRINHADLIALLEQRQRPAR